MQMYLIVFISPNFSLLFFKILNFRNHLCEIGKGILKIRRLNVALSSIKKSNFPKKTAFKPTRMYKN
jgi:hypothetical protein